MDIKINRLDGLIDVKVDGFKITNVCNYEIKSSASGETELVLVLVGNINVFELSTNLTEQMQ